MTSRTSRVNSGIRRRYDRSRAAGLKANDEDEDDDGDDVGAADVVVIFLAGKSSEWTRLEYETECESIPTLCVSRRERRRCFNQTCFNSVSESVERCHHTRDQ